MGQGGDTFTKLGSLRRVEVRERGGAAAIFSSIGQSPGRQRSEA